MEARQWAGGRTSKKKYRMLKSQRPDGTIAGSTKRLTSGFYRLKMGHCLTGQCLQRMKNRHTGQCWWCRCQVQTQDHLFKVCPEWTAQQKIPWAEVLKEGGKWKVEEPVGDSGSPGRWAVQPGGNWILSATDVGRLVPAEEDAGSEASEWEVWEWEEDKRAQAEELGAAGELGAGGELPLFLPTPSFMASADEE